MHDKLFNYNLTITDNHSNINERIFVDTSQNVIEFDNRDFGNNDKKVLNLFNLDTNSEYSFNGMTKKLKMHQQSLSRALKRLEYLGIIEKTDAGYKLNKSSISYQTNNIDSKYDTIGREFIPVAKISFPHSVNFDIIINNMEGKWFDNLRWIGIRNRQSTKVLVWVFHTNQFNNFEVNMSVDYITKSIDIQTNAKSEQEKIHSIFLASKLIYNMGLLLNIKTSKMIDYKINSLMNN